MIQYRLKNLEKVVFPIAVVLVLAFSSLSGDVLPFVNRYPMKKFAEHINQENIKGPIGTYKLGSHRARLGVLTGRTVITLHSFQHAKNFLKTNKKDFQRHQIKENILTMHHLFENLAWFYLKNFLMDQTFIYPSSSISFKFSLKIDP